MVKGTIIEEKNCFLMIRQKIYAGNSTNEL